MSELQKLVNTSRSQFGTTGLDEKDLEKDPLKLFEKWLKLAFEKNVHEPYAMNLATVNDQGHPSSRIVLLRDFSPDGFVFYTNYESRKALNIVTKHYAALNFYWHELGKQIRIEGSIEKVSSTVSDNYFESRPRESQLGAWASQQSKTLQSREELEKEFRNLEKQFEGKTVPRPAHWGGFILNPNLYEFWQGRENRLHDRFQFVKQNNSWKIERLCP